MYTRSALLTLDYGVKFYADEEYTYVQATVYQHIDCREYHNPGIDESGLRWT